MERLLAMQERVVARQAESAFAEDLAKLQLELPVIRKLGKGHNSTYAKWEHINEEIKPFLAKYGFALSFRTEPAEVGLTIVGELTHKLGHKRECKLPVPFDDSGKKNPIQARGSSMSYGKRYTAGFLLNITTIGEDDDGYSAGHTSHPRVTMEEARGVWQRWKLKNPKGKVTEFEKWVDDTCGVLKPDNPTAWRVEDLDKCHAELDR